jgi:AbrB family looped-hinge helix DNA binding protein
MAQTKTIISAGGRVIIPVRYRRTLGLEEGDEVVILLEEDGLRIMTPRQAIARAQALVRRHVPARKRLAAELIRERRAEAKREKGRG